MNDSPDFYLKISLKLTKQFLWTGQHPRGISMHLRVIPGAIGINNDFLPKKFVSFFL